MYTVKRFCALVQISERNFQILKAQVRAPDLTRLGRNLRITHAAAKDWIDRNIERVA